MDICMSHTLTCTGAHTQIRVLIKGQKNTHYYSRLSEVKPTEEYASSP